MSADYALLAKAFDALAPTYDQQYSASANALMQWMRRESQTVMLQAFPSGGHLLEIGCGTGEDAISLATHGFNIFATDVSDEMTAIAQSKVTSAGLTGQIEISTIPAGHLNKHVKQTIFDGAYSNFGALNCEPDLEAVATALCNHLRPGAAFVCTVMAPMCPIEVLWFATHLQLGEATRRRKRGWHNVRVSDAAGKLGIVPTKYLTYSDLRRVFIPHFSIEYVMSLPLLLPPPYLATVYQRFARLWTHLESIERLMRDRWPFNRMGDHILLVMRRR